MKAPKAAYTCPKCNRQITLLVQPKGIPTCSKCGRNMVRQDKVKQGA